VHAVFTRPVSRIQAWDVLRAAPGVVVTDDPQAGEFPTPVDVVGTDPSWVGRIRQSLDDPRAIEFFVCGDNLRKGAALNTAQIAELVAAELGQRPLRRPVYNGNVTRPLPAALVSGGRKGLAVPAAARRVLPLAGRVRRPACRARSLAGESGSAVMRPGGRLQAGQL